MREVILHFTLYTLHFSLCALGAIMLFAFGRWLHRLDVFRIARALFCSVKGAAFGILLAVAVAKGGAKLNLGLGPLLQVGSETNVVEYAVTPAQVEVGFALAHTGTNETWNFSLPANANIHAPWLLRGANQDRFTITSTTSAPWAFPLGTNVFDGLLVSSSGVLVPKFLGEPYVPRSRRAVFAPFYANLGAVPQMNWPAPGEDGARSQFGWWLTSSNSLVLAWHEFLYNRDSATPVSFQTEFFWNGDFIYRYDLASVNTNLTSLLYRRVVPEDLDGGDRDGDGISSAEEIFRHGTDPDLSDTDGDEPACARPLRRGHPRARRRIRHERAVSRRECRRHERACRVDASRRLCRRLDAGRDECHLGAVVRARPHERMAAVLRLGLSVQRRAVAPGGSVA